MKINWLIIVILFFLFIIDVLIYKSNKDNQLNEIFLTASNIKKELENNIQSGINSVKFLNASAQSILANKNNIQIQDTLKIKEIDSQGNYVLDLSENREDLYTDKVNLTGYGGLKKDKKTQLEMEMSLLLTPIYKVIKESNDMFSWVYYYSNNNFMTLYPFIPYKNFVLSANFKEKPLFQYATHQNNPKREAFFTPLYMDGTNVDLMVTLGIPLYDQDDFMGVLELDITLKKHTEYLKRLDALNNYSAIINKENEVIAVHNLATPNLTQVMKIDTLLKDEVINLKDTKDKLSLKDGKYIYNQKFVNAPWRLIYYKDALEVEFIAILYTLPIFLLMLLIFYIDKLWQKSNQQAKDLSLMIKELHHRVKNNFQVILTFLWAQKKLTKDKSSLAVLEQTTQRIYAISSLHELLSISDTVTVDIKNYLEGIVDSFSTHNNKLIYKCDVEDIVFSYDRAVSLGLILNELITNSNKYAFESIDKPLIDISFFKEEEKYIFNYSDNGIGFNVEKTQENSGLGYELIYGFTAKHNAIVTLTSNNGMQVQIEFYEENK